MRKIIFSLVFVVAVSLFPVSVMAGPNPFNFGGKVSTVFPCLNGIWATIIGPSGGSYFYKYGVSGLKAFGPPKHPGQNVLGKSAGFMFCFVPVPFPPFVIPVGGGLLVMPNAGSSAL